MIKTIWQKLGPGLLYAATAVGVSHLVSSTQAGGQYGLIMIVFVIFICLLKYPTFLFGARYTAATGETLIEGYEKKGRWILYVFFAIQLFEFTFAISGVSVTTAALFKSIFKLQASDLSIAMSLLVVCLIILTIGRYAVLEGISKVLVITMSILTVIAAAIAFAGVDTHGSNLSAGLTFDTPTILFLIAVAGWMPTGMAGAVSISVWVKAKEERLGRLIEVKEAEFDFNLGYAIAIFTAVCFVLLGTIVMYSAQIPLASSSSEFADQLFSLFTQTLGEWAYVIIALAATTVMLSTLLALVDLLPRTSTAVAMRIAPKSFHLKHKSKVYLFFIVVELVLVTLVLWFLLGESFTKFMSMVISMGFIVAPPIAILNHMMMFSSWVPKDGRPGNVIRYWSWFTIVTLTIITIIFVYLDLWPRIIG